MAGIALQTFVNHFRNVGIRTGIMYKLSCSSGINEVDNVLSLLNLYASGWKAPNRSIKYEDVKFRAYPCKVPTAVENGQDHTFDCICDIAGYARNAFCIWQNSVIDADFSSGSIFGGNKRFPVTSNIRLELLADDMSTTVQTILITGVNIVDVGELTMSNDNANICKFTVKLNSLWWNYEGGEGSSVLTTSA